MRIAVTCVYAPTEVAVVSAKSQFQSELRKAIKCMDGFPKFKSFVVGDFNATIGHQSKMSGAWDDCLGWNNSGLNRHRTNDNGARLLKFASENKYRLINTLFRSKRIHRD